MNPGITSASLKNETQNVYADSIQVASMNDKGPIDLLSIQVEMTEQQTLGTTRGIQFEVPNLITSHQNIDILYRT